ncbi:MAG: hypothetical protein Kow0054_04690 [Deferrisoma sp.]
MRQAAEGVEYVEEDPGGGTTLEIRAKRAVERDAKVLGFFRTPLRREVALEAVSVRLRSRTITLEASARRGTFSPGRGAVRLAGQVSVRVDGMAAEPEEALIGRSGDVAFRGRVWVPRKGRGLAVEEGYAGPVDGLAAWLRAAAGGEK